MQNVKGCVIFNPYYTDDGQAYVKRRLADCFLKRGVTLADLIPYAAAGFDKACLSPSVEKVDFAVFWDKDVLLAKYLERNGIRVFNNSFVIETCDDKRKTYECLLSDTACPVPLIPTVFSRLAFHPSETGDAELLACVESALGYPLVVKENVGSLGKQVYLAQNRAELEALHTRLFQIPHQFQRFVGAGGADTRVYTVGGRAVAAVRRTNAQSFISNAAQGGETARIELADSLKALSEAVARALRLDFGAVDFLEENGRYFFLEANSNAYFKAAESLGLDIAGQIADHIIKNF